MRKTDKKLHIVKRAILSLAMAALPFAAHAAGLGKIAVFSALGQPLRAEIEVFSTGDEAASIQTKLATADAFRQADIEYAPVLVNLKFSPVKERDGHRYIQVTTERPLNEPFVDMLVELNWASGRLVREYTFLLDPPGLADATTAAPVSVAAPVVRPEVAAVSSAQETPPGAPSAEASHAKSDHSLATKKTNIPHPVTKADDAARKMHTVAAGDTLGKIAAQNLPAGVSLDQMLVALFRNNQQAFSGSNMNRLRAGKILMIPDSEAVNSLAVKEARREVVAQAADFNAYRKKLAALAATEAVEQETAQQASGGKIVPKVENALPASSSKDKLEVSRTEIAKDGKGGKPQGRAASEEDMVARDRALKEANDRVAELEKKLDNMKKLAELKSQTGSNFQQQAQETKLAVAPSPTTSVSGVQKSGEPDSAASAPGTGTPPAVAAPAETVKPLAATPPPAVKPKKKVVLPPPEPEPSFMEENGTLVFGGGGLLALALGWFGFAAWKKRKAVAEAEDMAVAEPGFSVHSGFSAPTSVADGAQSFSEQQPSQFSGSISPAESAMDALTEADTFLAFGRDAQAEEVLLAALETEPGRHAIYLKLLEIYAARKNRAAFGSMAKRLHEQTGGGGDDWAKAAAMGALLDPENTLYKPASAAPSMEPAPVAPQAGAQDFGSTLVMQASPLAAELPEAAARATSLAVDFDLGETAHVDEAVAAVPDMAVLDFDLDLDSPNAGASTEPVTPAGTDPASAPLDMPRGEETVPATAKTTAEDDTNSIDFDFDLVLDTPSAAAPAAPLDLGGIDLNLDALGTPDAVPPAPIFDVTGGTDMAESPEVATKLELAAAYEEMGDREGARELYQEALAEGNPVQQDAARSKLASLG